MADDKKPDPLPKSEDGFWDGAEVEKIQLGPSVTCAQGDHVFFRMKQNEAQCQKCPLGYILPPGWDVTGRGRITAFGELVV